MAGNFIGDDREALKEYLNERNAYLLNGVSIEMAIDPFPDPWRTPADDELDELVDREPLQK